MIYTSADQLIGKTPLLELTHIEKKLDLKAKILAKLEYFNPAGSVKDRIAKAMIDDAEARGLLKEGSVLIEPTSGEILIDGEKADPRKHNLSFVFQEPSAMPWLTVEDNIAFGMEIKGWPKKRIKEQTDKIIELMGLTKSRKQYPHELSVSTEQKVVIGRAFAMEPDLLLMDEPFTGLDDLTRQQVIHYIFETKARRPLILVTHETEGLPPLRSLHLSPR